MKYSKIFLFLSCLVMLTFLMAHSANAGCAIKSDGSSAIDTNKNAPGTKLSGPLTTYYDDGVLHYFVRLRKGMQLYIFAGYKPLPNGGNGQNAWITDAQPIIIEWFEETVIPEIYECREDLDNCPFEAVELKSFEMDVFTDDPGYVPNEIDGVSIMDIVVAVDE